MVKTFFSQSGNTFMLHVKTKHIKTCLEICTELTDPDLLMMFFALYRSGLVESRIRQLVMKLEVVDHLSLAHPFIKGFDNIKYSDDSTNSSTTTVTNPDGTTTTTTTTTTQPKAPVYETLFYIGLQIEPRGAGATQPRKLDITWPTREFIMMCKQWEQYDEAAMGIQVVYIKSSGLPRDLLSDEWEKGTKRMQVRS